MFSLALVGGAFAIAMLERAAADPRPGRTVCVSRVAFGVRCPGCGLTDSFVAMAKGQLSAASAANPLGPVLFALLALVALTRLVKWRTPRFGGWRRIDAALAVACFGALLVRSVAFYLG